MLGGWLTDNYNWRWVFLVNLPVGMMCALVMMRFMPKTETHKRNFDMFGFILLGLALGGLQLFLDRGEQSGLAAELGNLHRARPGHSRFVDVRRPHGDGEAAACSSGRCLPTATSRPAWSSWR